MGMYMVLLYLEDQRHCTSTAQNKVVSSQGYRRFYNPLTQHVIPPETTFNWTYLMETRHCSRGNMIFVVFDSYPMFVT